MTRRVPSGEERDLFEQTLKDAKPLKPRSKPQASPAAQKESKQPRKPVPVAAPAPPPPPPPRPAGPSGLDGRTSERLRRGLLAPEARLDLHGLTEAAAHRALITFVMGAQARGARLLLIVTGKGAAKDESATFDMLAERAPRGILREMTPRWLKERELGRLVADVRAAHRRHGGEGALYVYLRKRPG